MKWQPAGKYKNHRVIAPNGETFDSKREFYRWQELVLLEQGKAIWDLKRQVRYKIELNGQKICDYVADFTYQTPSGSVVEDSKGYKTPIYRLKKKLMKALFNVEIFES